MVRRTEDFQQLARWTESWLFGFQTCHHTCLLLQLGFVVVLPKANMRQENIRKRIIERNGVIIICALDGIRMSEME
jgi:hypothetical protein